MSPSPSRPLTPHRSTIGQAPYSLPWRGTRLVKTPKIYFTDVGTLCHLSGLKDPDHAAAGPMGGAIFETAVLTEIMKTLLHRGENPQIYFWRTSYWAEVDIVVDAGGKLILQAAARSGTSRLARCSPILSDHPVMAAHLARRLRLPMQREEWVRDFPLTSPQEPFILLSKIQPNRR